MNKIAIVGHPASGHDEVEALLLRCGMKGALPSRREGLLPADITSTLCKAHNARAMHEVTEEDEFLPIETGKVWHGMALDLMLGNLEHDLWGWSDPQTIFLLNYWRDLDPKLVFVLVYDEPQRVLLEAATWHAHELTLGLVQQRLDNWAAYNGAMLTFYLRNQDRCLLVNSQQVRHAVDGYLQKLQALMGAPLAATPAVLPTLQEEPPAIISTSNAPEENELLISEKIDAPADANTLPDSRTLPVPAGTVERHLVDQFLSEKAAYLQLYEELQSAASLPLKAPNPARNRTAHAWLDLLRQCSFFNEAHAQLQLRLSDLQHKHDLVYADFEAERTDHAHTMTELGNMQASLSELRNVISENELLLAQLHQTQEYLESFHIENQHLKLQIPPPKPLLYGAPERIKRQLSYRLGAQMIYRAKSMSGWIGMPWFITKEALAFRKEQAQRTSETLPPIHEYQDAAAAERTKQHLSYRLGSAMIKHARTPTGWILLPFALLREALAFRRQRKKE